MNKGRKRQDIPQNVREILWAKTAGRCEMIGCNKLVYESAITHDCVKAGEVAHNIAASENGPRGNEKPFWHHIDSSDDTNYNAIDNLLLLCPECHTEVDKNPQKYTVEILREMKWRHERRIRILTQITDDRECLLVSFVAPIAKRTFHLTQDDMAVSLSRSYYFSGQENRIDLSINSDIKDGEAVKLQANILQGRFTTFVKPRLEEQRRTVAVFALAPIPLLIYLGTLFPTGTRLLIFQKLRNSTISEWYWAPSCNISSVFSTVTPPKPNQKHLPCLVLEGTDYISDERIMSSIQESEDKVDIWRIQAKSPRYDLECNDGVLKEWNALILETMNKMRSIYGHHIPIRIFPAINNALAIETGIARLEKTDPEWIIYDNIETEQGSIKFVESFSIGGKN